MVVLGVFASVSPVTLTPEGQHCPTAQVSVIHETVQLTDCCGNVVEKTIQRQPHLGDREFVQCRCAEKKSTESNCVKESKLVASVPAVFCKNPLVIALPLIRENEAIWVADSMLVEARPEAPEVPPPNRSMA